MTAAVLNSIVEITDIEVLRAAATRLIVEQQSAIALTLTLGHGQEKPPSRKRPWGL
jgi:hypothetical protein